MYFIHDAKGTQMTTIYDILDAIPDIGDKFARELTIARMAFQAGQEHGYGEHRRVLFDYVRNLETQHPTLKGGPMKFRKKPVVIDAIQWTGSNLGEVIAFTDGPPDTRTTHAVMAWENYAELVARDGLKIFTLEGKMLASVGDWIIKGVAGEHYPCKPEIFAATYESAARPPQQSAQPVLRVDSWTNGSYDRNYKVTWLRDVPEGTLLYAAAQPVEVQRVGLQPAQVEAIHDALMQHTRTADIWTFASAIEAAHGIKPTSNG